MKCDTCSKKKYGYLCDGCIHDPNTEDADKYEDKYEYMTNADRIRAMTDEELAGFLDKCEARGYLDSSIARDASDHCIDMLDWLQQPCGRER